jgi:hypothetical protein
MISNAARAAATSAPVESRELVCGARTTWTPARPVAPVAVAGVVLAPVAPGTAVAGVVLALVAPGTAVAGVVLAPAAPPAAAPATPVGPVAARAGVVATDAGTELVVGVAGAGVVVAEVPCTRALAGVGKVGVEALWALVGVLLVALATAGRPSAGSASASASPRGSHLRVPSIALAMLEGGRDPRGGLWRP